jgi:hypothetical protein
VDVVGGLGALLLLAFLAALALQVVALVDATRRPEEALDARGWQDALDRSCWPVALVVPVVSSSALVYLLARPATRRRPPVLRALLSSGRRGAARTR